MHINEIKHYLGFEVKKQGKNNRSGHPPSVGPNGSSPPTADLSHIHANV
jgi:hypothetical protein